MSKNCAPAQIKTDRLLLHSLTNEDMFNLIDLLINKEVGKTYMVPPLETDDKKIKLFEAIKRLSYVDDKFVYGIYLNDKLIGLINEVDTDGDAVELGIAIHPTYKGNGYATEVLSASFCCLFDMGYTSVKTAAFEENIASIRVMEKCLMTRLSEITETEYNGKIHKCVWFEKRKEINV